MSVLVAYASRHGATQGIAERIASRLQQRGVDAVARPASDVRDATPYDAFVIGSAAYMFHWLGEATDFAKRNRDTLSRRPVWLFSSGPIGTETTDAKGRDVLATSEPREFATFRDSLHPREERVFFGAFDPAARPIGMAESVMHHLPATARKAMPAGDYRDWAVIEAWADSIAEGLTSVQLA